MSLHVEPSPLVRPARVYRELPHSIDELSESAKEAVRRRADPFTPSGFKHNYAPTKYEACICDGANVCHCGFKCPSCGNEWGNTLYREPREVRIGFELLIVVGPFQFAATAMSTRTTTYVYYRGVVPSTIRFFIINCISTLFRPR